MHDIHEPSVKCATEKLIPALIDQGYKLVTVSEMAEAKNVTLQNACYVDFWPSTLSNGDVPGYQGGSDAAASADGTDGTSDASTDSSDGSTDSSDGSGDYSDGSSDDGRTNPVGFTRSYGSDCSYQAIGYERWRLLWM